MFKLVNSNGATISAPGYEVLVLYNGGTLCDTDGWFNSYASDAICKKMGYEGSNSWSSGHSHSFQNNYPMMLDNVRCSSNLLWSSCLHDYGIGDCSHYNDVYLNCIPKQLVVTDAGNISAFR